MGQKAMESQKVAKEERSKLVGRTFRHFKGGLYLVEDVAVGSESEEPVVIYSSVSNRDYLWARPLSSFKDHVIVSSRVGLETEITDGCEGAVPRFKEVTTSLKTDDQKSVDMLYDYYTQCKEICNESTRKISNLEHDLKQSKTKERVALLEYRSASVLRVLDRVDDLLRCGEVDEIRTLIVHCINKLNGNIDGVELGLLNTKDEVRF